MTPAARCLEGAWPRTPSLVALGVIAFVALLLFLAQQELLRDKTEEAAAAAERAGAEEPPVAGYEKVTAFAVILAVVTLVYVFAALYTYKRICSW